MKIVVFGDDERVGALVGDRVIDLNRAFANVLRERGEANPEQAANSRIPASLDRFIQGGDATLDDAERAIEAAEQQDPAGVVFSRSAVKLLAPWPQKRIAMVGGNYGRHLLGMWANRVQGEVTVEAVEQLAREGGQWGFWKTVAEVAADGDDVPFPEGVEYLDYEGEAAIVLGKAGKHINADRIDDYVWGITLTNDWSSRDPVPNPMPISYNLMKNFDRAVSMGPCIVVRELQCQNVPVEVRVNGELRQQFNTSEMIWGFGEVLEYLSRTLTFVPGDIISGGTSAGTAADLTGSKRTPDGKRPMDLFIKVGDVVEVYSDPIGPLTNKVVEPD